MQCKTVGYSLLDQSVESRYVAISLQVLYYSH